MHNSRKTSPSLILALMAALPLTQAHAHAPAEVTQLVSTAPGDVILSTNRGLIFGTRAGGSLLCGNGFGIGVSTPFRVALLPSGRLLIAGSDAGGMRFSDDRGCTVRAVPALAGIDTPFMVQHPSQRARVYVATFGTGEGGVRRSEDNGESFAKLLSVGDDDFVGSLLVTPGTPDQLYAGITSFPADAPRFRFFVSRSVDGGMTWDRNEVLVEDNEVDVALLAVNPAAPEQLVVRATAKEPHLGERVLFSRDGGKTFSAVATVPALRAALFSRDGKVLYVGGSTGLQRAQLGSGTPTFEPVGSSARVSLLEQLDDQLLVTGYYQGLEAGVDGVGAGTFADPSFSSWFDLNNVQAAVQCPAPSPVNEECAALFRDWLLENPNGTQPGTGDAGMRDAAVAPMADASSPATDALDAGAGSPDTPDAQAGAAGTKTSDGGCSLGASTSGRNVPGLCWLGLGLFLGRRRARPRPLTDFGAVPS